VQGEQWEDDEMTDFGWSYPPGCNSVPGDEPDPPCEVCGKFPDHRTDPCKCPECPGCGEFGNPECYGKPGHLSDMGWTQITKRTNDPKLTHFEKLLADNGIPSRRHGESFHAPILQVTKDKHEKAYGLLSSDVFGDGSNYDEIPDDDPVFVEAYIELKGTGWDES
jgi:hypothetical protein